MAGVGARGARGILPGPSTTSVAGVIVSCAVRSRSVLPSWGIPAMSCGGCVRGRRRGPRSGPRSRVWPSICILAEVTARWLPRLSRARSRLCRLLVALLAALGLVWVVEQVEVAHGASWGASGAVLGQGAQLLDRKSVV